MWEKDIFAFILHDNTYYRSFAKTKLLNDVHGDVHEVVHNNEHHGDDVLHDLDWSWSFPHDLRDPRDPHDPHFDRQDLFC